MHRMEFARIGMFQSTPYAVGVIFQSPGSRPSRAPWVSRGLDTFTPKALYKVSAHVTPRMFNTFGVSVIAGLKPRVRRCAATLGFGIQPLRGRKWQAHAISTNELAIRVGIADFITRAVGRLLNPRKKTFKMTSIVQIENGKHQDQHSKFAAFR